MSAFPRWGSLNFHYRDSHPGVSAPPSEECKKESLPAGYSLKTAQKSAARSVGETLAESSSGATNTSSETGSKTNEGKDRYPPGLERALDDADRLGDILETYGAKEQNIERIKKVYRFDKSLQINPHNLEIVLKTWLDKELHSVIPMIVGQFFGTTSESEVNGTRYIPIGFRRTPEGGYQQVYSMPGYVSRIFCRITEASGVSL
jgi:hypothetical protein